MKLKLFCLGLLALVAITAPAIADDTNASSADASPTNAARMAETTEFLNRLKLATSLKYQTGTISLPGGAATLHLPTNICYLSPDDADTVLVKLWGNLPGPKTLGMLVPADKKPYERGCWAVTIASSDDGYVKDNDAGKMNYGDMLKQLQTGAKEESKERAEKGLATYEIAGWAEPPHYDATTHKLYWAMDLKVDGAAEDTLNYDIRILGRRGYLVLGAIADMGQLQQIREETPQLLAAVDFNEGSRYTDFDPKVDKVATYGIGALVVGGIAAKLGFFKLLWVGLLAAKKFIIIGFVAMGTWLKKVFGRRKDPTA